MSTPPRAHALSCQDDKTYILSSGHDEQIENLQYEITMLSGSVHL